MSAWVARWERKRQMGKKEGVREPIYESEACAAKRGVKIVICGIRDHCGRGDREVV